jgi:hypothetical protein
VRCTLKQIKIAAHLTFLELGTSEREYDKLYWMSELSYQLGRLHENAFEDLSFDSFRQFVAEKAEMHYSLTAKIWNNACTTPR